MSKRWLILLAGLPALGALALLWRVRDTPLALGPFARIDALSAFFLFALLGGAALALAARPANLAPGWPRRAAALGALALAYSTTLTPAIACAYLIVALLTLDSRRSPAIDTARSRAGQAARIIRRAALAAPGLLAASCLLLGYGALELRGAARYDDRIAGMALDSFAFWFVLLAAAIACSPLFHPANSDESRAIEQSAGLSHPSARGRFGEIGIVEIGLLRCAWLYPLARLYSLGPWNSGWSYATLLLGGALALWCASSGLAQPGLVRRNAYLQSIYLALALAGLGLSTSAGVAAACFGILAYLALNIGAGDVGLGAEDESDLSPAIAHLPSATLLPWLLSSAIPLTAPFVAAWMLIGASVAGGVALLAGVTWLVALLHGLAVALWSGSAPVQARRPLLAAGAASLLLGVGAPLIVRALIQPAVAQLQGGLTPYGDVNIWPWVGLAASDSAHTQATTLPSIAIALLMLVLSAIVYVVARLRQLRGAGSQRQAAEARMPAATLLRSIRDEVPWLGGLLGSKPRSQRQPGDGE
jgi:hypothetical protein